MRCTPGNYNLDLIKSMSYKLPRWLGLKVIQVSTEGRLLKRAVGKSAGLAPMEGVTDFATRSWFRFIGGMDFLWTPFLRVTDTFPSSFPAHFAPEITRLKGRFNSPTVIQLMASRPEDVVRVAETLKDSVSFIDLNCGCPSPTVVGSRAGSSLLERVDGFASFVEKVTAGVGPGRLSVKMRTGFALEAEFKSLVSVLKPFPLRHLTVHGRTRVQRYTGVANWNLINYAANECPFPVIGSGDICHVGTLTQCLSEDSATDSVIIGRGALRNPWIFRGDKYAPITMSLLLYVVMQDIFLENPDTLVNWTAEEPDRPLVTADDYRILVSNALRYADRSHFAIEDIEVSPRALSRGKMLWNYIRSSLPDAFLEGQIMRSNRLTDFISGIIEISRQLGLDPDNLPIGYHSDRDWMYSGQGRSR